MTFRAFLVLVSKREQGGEEGYDGKLQTCIFLQVFCSSTVLEEVRFLLIVRIVTAQSSSG